MLGKYVREERALTLPDAVRRMAALPAHNLGLRDRGLIKTGYHADVVVFDPATVGDHATYDNPRQYSTGVSEVVVNGVLSLRGGAPTGALGGKVVRGRAWKGWPDGGCRKSAKEWTW